MRGSDPLGIGSIPVTGAIFIMSKLSSKTVLVLNRHYQPIDRISPKQAFCAIVDGARGVYVDEHRQIHAMNWDAWTSLPHGDHYVTTPRAKIRIPNVIISNCAKMPVKTRKCTKKEIWLRDGFRCQYTGKTVIPGKTGNIDHIVPRSEGGRSTWTNMVVSSVKVNSAKGPRTPKQAGLRTLSTPKAPKPVPVCATIIEPAHPDWEPFIIKK